MALMRNGPVLPRRRRIRRIVEAAIRRPRLRRSRWTRAGSPSWDCLGPSAPPARPRSGRRVDGRPGSGRSSGWVSRRRCQHRTVAAVTSRYTFNASGRSLIRAASTARSVQSCRGLGFRRRRTAFSCRKTRISTSLAERVRESKTSHEMMRQSTRYTGAATRNPIMPEARRWAPRPARSTTVTGIVEPHTLPIR